MGWLLALLVHLAAAASASGHSQIQQMVARLEQLEKNLSSGQLEGPQQLLALMDKANLLHTLNHLKPDGGLRVPEAEKAYR